MICLTKKYEKTRFIVSGKSNLLDVFHELCQLIDSLSRYHPVIYSGSKLPNSYTYWCRILSIHYSRLQIWQMSPIVGAKSTRLLLHQLKHCSILHQCDALAFNPRLGLHIQTCIRRSCRQNIYGYVSKCWDTPQSI